MIEDITIIFNIIRTIIIGGISYRIVQVFLKCQSGEVSLKDGITKAKKVMKAGIIASVLPSLMPYINQYYFSYVVSTSGGATFSLILLFNGVISMIMSIEPIMVIYLIVKELIQYNVAGDEMKTQHKENVKTIMVIGISIICCTTCVYAVLSYFR